MEEWHQLVGTAWAVLVAAVAVGHVVACNFVLSRQGSANMPEPAASFTALAPCGAVTLVARALCGFTGLGLPSRALIVGAASTLTVWSLLEDPERKWRKKSRPRDFPVGCCERSAAVHAWGVVPVGLRA